MPDMWTSICQYRRWSDEERRASRLAFPSEQKATRQPCASTDSIMVPDRRGKIPLSNFKANLCRNGSNIAKKIHPLSPSVKRPKSENQPPNPTPRSPRQRAHSLTFPAPSARRNSTASGTRKKKIGCGEMPSKSVGRFIMQVVLPRREARSLVVILQVGVGLLNLVVVNRPWAVFSGKGRE